MKATHLRWVRLGAMAAGFLLAASALLGPVQAQEPAAKPNILFIMGDDIGWMQPSIYHRGLMVGETPNIDRIGREGSIFMDYVAMQSCTSGRNAFLHGDVSAAHGLDSAGAAGQPGLSAARHPGGRGVPA
jgi:arylsulfatase A-like enzyme